MNIQRIIFINIVVSLFSILMLGCTRTLAFDENEKVSFDNVPIGAASLAFVFDITGSMMDDLRQVIEGAAKILTTTLARGEKPLYNYVLVPFHDPGKKNFLSIFLITKSFKDLNGPSGLFKSWKLSALGVYQ